MVKAATGVASVEAWQSRPRYVRVSKFVALTGYTAKAVYHKISDGVWLEGREYRYAPDGNICIDLEGFDRWVEGERALASSPSKAASGSASTSTERADR